MVGDVGIVRRTPPFIINGELHHYAVESLTGDRLLIKTFDVSRVCDRGPDDMEEFDL